MKSNVEYYNYINKNKMSFLGVNSKFNKYEKFKNWYIGNRYDFNIPIEELHSMEDLYLYLLGESKKYCECGKSNKFRRFSEGYSKFCSSLCLFNWRSNKMQGANNAWYKTSEETKKSIAKKVSVKIKSRILDGSFTPAVTNSWARSRCKVKINRNGKNIIVLCRSSWEAYFQLLNPNLIYERIRIPYQYGDLIRNYIVDFVDLDNNILYEIKPESNKELKINKLKIEAALAWSINNRYEYKIISNDWFIKHYDETILLGQDKKLKRLLKQFKQ